MSAVYDDITVEADWFDEAADLIEKHGWVQGWMKTPDGFCLLGAARHASGSDKYRAVLWALSKFPPETAWTEGGRWYDIAEWNDEGRRTKQQVLDHLRFVAKELRSNE